MMGFATDKTAFNEPALGRSSIPVRFDITPSNIRHDYHRESSSAAYCFNDHPGVLIEKEVLTTADTVVGLGRARNSPFPSTHSALLS